MARPKTRRLVAAGAALFLALIAFLCVKQGASAHSTPVDAAAASHVLQTSAEEQLAIKYNPILKLTEQRRPCTKTGNVYNPAPVDIILGNPDVQLRILDGDRTVIKTAPTAEDVAGLDEDHDLNWPGNPRRPGCTYERDYLALVQSMGLKPTVYAHVATEDGEPGIAVQYWYNYYYNDFANKHEGDWEMVQVMFDDADTVEEALQQDPTRTAYSGHAGGELADWTDKKLEKIDGRPVVYVTTGAHAAHYSEGTFIGVAKRGQVFGCDPTTGPHRTVDPELVMLPDQPPATGEFAWLTFAGLWGEESGSLFSGIAGPAVRERWYEPFTWANDLRDFSDKIPDNFLGIDPVGAICAVVNTGSDIMLFYGEHPFIVGAGAVITMGMLGAVLVYGAPSWLTGRPGGRVALDPKAPVTPGRGFLRRERLLRQLVRGALRIYAAHWPLWMVIGAVMVPISLLVMFLEQLVGLEWMVDMANTTAAAPASELVGMTVGAFIGASVVSVAVFAALRDLDEGNPPSVVRRLPPRPRPRPLHRRRDRRLHRHHRTALLHRHPHPHRRQPRRCLGRRRPGPRRGGPAGPRLPRSQRRARHGQLAPRPRHRRPHRPLRGPSRPAHRLRPPHLHAPAHHRDRLPAPLRPLRPRPLPPRLHRLRPPLRRPLRRPSPPRPRSGAARRARVGVGREIGERKAAIGRENGVQGTAGAGWVRRGNGRGGRGRSGSGYLAEVCFAETRLLGWGQG